MLKKRLVYKLISGKEYNNLISPHINTGMDSYDFTDILIDNSKKFEHIYGVTVDGYLFSCNGYFGDGYNPYNYKYEPEKRELLKKEVRNLFIDQLKEK